MTEVIELRAAETTPKMSKGLRWPYVVLHRGNDGYEYKAQHCETRAGAKETASRCSNFTRIIHINLPPMVMSE